MLQESGFTNVVIGEGVDTFGGAKGEDRARAFAGVRLRIHGAPPRLKPRCGGDVGGRAEGYAVRLAGDAARSFFLPGQAFGPCGGNEGGAAMKPDSCCGGAIWPPVS